MAESFKIKCECGAYLRVVCSGEIAPGNRMHEEAFCPKCRKSVYSTHTSGFVSVETITEEQYNNPDFE